MVGWDMQSWTIMNTVSCYVTVSSSEIAPLVKAITRLVCAQAAVVPFSS